MINHVAQHMLQSPEEASFSKPIEIPSCYHWQNIYLDDNCSVRILILLFLNTFFCFQYCPKGFSICFFSLHRLTSQLKVRYALFI